MKIAILGAGFAGLAIAWNLAQKHSVTLFDPHIGQASSVAAGLLHTYVGLHAKYNLYGLEGYEEALKLLKIASKTLNQPVYVSSGLLRPAISDSQKLDFQICADKHADVEWLTSEQVQKSVPGICNYPGILIKSAITVYPDLYLRGLSSACILNGMHIEKEAITALRELDDFDTIIIAAGAQTLSFPGCESFRLSLIKGQIVELAWPANLPPLPLPLSSQAYIVMNRDHKSCIIGSTYERGFTSDGPDLSIALDEILPKAASIIPDLASAKVLGARAGVRVSAPDHMPLIKQISSKIWIFTGLGSKGLLYHALYAKRLADLIHK